MGENPLYIMMQLCEMLTDKSLSSAEKINRIKSTFELKAQNFYFDTSTQRYFEIVDRNDFPGDRAYQRYLEETGGLAVNSPGRIRWTLAMVAAREGELEVLKWLIDEQGANADEVNANNFSPLHLAASEGHVETVKYLLTKEINIDRKSHSRAINAFLPGKQTALHLAVRVGNLEICKLLLEANARFLVDDNYQSPYELAKWYLVIIRQLFEDDLRKVYEEKYSAIESLLKPYYVYGGYNRSIQHKEMSLPERAGAKLLNTQFSLFNTLSQNNTNKSRLPLDIERNIMSFLNGEPGKFAELVTQRLNNDEKTERHQQHEQVQEQEMEGASFKNSF